MSSGLPLAAWGLAWGLAAFALPLAGLLRLAEGRPAPALWSATRLAAAAGVLAVVVLFGVSLGAGTVCAGCFVVYVLVAGYAGIALYGWRTGWPDLPRGAVLAALAAALAAALLLFPGTRTPARPGEAGRDAVAEAPAANLGPGTGDPQRDALLVEFVQSLSAPLRQTLADSLHIAASSPAVVACRSRGASSDRPGAPVRITEWSDVLCGHCAALHDTLEELRRRLPERQLQRGRAAVPPRRLLQLARRASRARLGPLPGREGDPVHPRGAGAGSSRASCSRARRG